MSDALAVRARWGEFFVTEHGSLLGAVALRGRDPDGLSPADYQGLTLIASSIYTSLAPRTTVTQYYVHYTGARISLRERQHPVSALLSEQRARHLNEKGLSSSAIVHFFEIEPRERLNHLTGLDYIKHGVRAVLDPRSRAAFLNQLGHRGAIYYAEAELEQQERALRQLLEDVVAKWAGIMEGRVLGVAEMWAHLRFLATFDPRLLVDAVNEPVPYEDCDLSLPSGDVRHRVVDGLDVLKIDGPVPRYVRLASVVRFEREPKHGMWAADGAPVLTPGDYVLMVRWSPISELKRAVLFKRREIELQRHSVDWMALISGHERMTQSEQHEAAKPAIREKLEELGQAEALDVRWGMVQMMVAVFGTSPRGLRTLCTDLDRVIRDNGPALTWEGVDLAYAYASFQPGGQIHSIRDLIGTSTQIAAGSLIYRTSTGQPIVSDLGGEEAQYVFETRAAEPFYLSPYVGGRSIMICVGPVGTGKTFMKNTLAAHFNKYGGLVRCIDVDPGTEALARLFGEDGAIFRVAGEGGYGFNPFQMIAGPNDLNGLVHLSDVLLLMLAGNDDPALQRLDEGEQSLLDGAIRKTLALPIDKRRLSACLAHMPASLRCKFARWSYGRSAGEAGRYAALFDAPRDAIGAFDKRFVVFNLQGLREDPAALKPVLSELFWRTTRVFEDPALRATPKVLDLDEAPQTLAIRECRDYILQQKGLTWRKHHASLNLWAQSPGHFFSLEGWDGIRTAASTFLFMADAQMDESLYRAAFKLSAGECAAIRALRPRRETYVVQRDLGVSKTLILDPEPIQDVVNTSHPREAALRDQLIEAHGFDHGLALAVEALERYRAATHRLTPITAAEHQAALEDPHARKAV